MAKRKSDRNKPQESKRANGVELKPMSYQPSKKELGEDISLPVSFDRMVDALFAADKDLKRDC